MLCKKLDILSPPITLYNKGLKYHSSKGAIVLSIISFVLIALLSIGEFIIFIYDADKPTLSSYNKYAPESGAIDFNSSSFFHFISMQKNANNPDEQEIDFESFRIIGFETYLDEYINDKNLSNFNHWLYGPCDNDTDTKDISNLITQKYLTKSACIKKYFDSKDQKYYDLNETKYKVPKIEHGTINFTKRIYSIVIEDCVDDSLQIIFNDSKKCKKENNEYIQNVIKNGFINFHFIDHEIQEDENISPIKKFFHTVDTKLSKDNFIINNLYFNPIILFLKSQGFFNNVMNNNYFYTLDRSSENIKEKNNKKNIYMGYYLWLNKRMNLYYIEHLTLIDAISKVGGVSNVIISIFFFINKILNSYAIYSDSKELFNFSIKQSKNNRKKIELNNSLFKNNFDLSKALSPSFKEKKQNSNKEKNNSSKVENKINKNDINLGGNANMCNDAYFKENDFKNSISSIIDEKEKKNFDKKKFEKKEKLRFSEYCKYKISCGKINGELQLYEYFRIKIVSIENLLNNYLKINDLIKLSNLTNK